MSFSAFSPIVRAAYAMLPDSYQAPGATAEVLAIGFQESNFEHRVQAGNGPARSFWQFERGGIQGVLNHAATKTAINSVLDAFGYDHMVETSYYAIRDNDVLAFCFARLLLYTLPDPLPTKDEPHVGWNQYFSTWRPGKPRSEVWAYNFDQGWAHASRV